MAPRELTRAQLSSKLSYQAQVPSFLQKLQNRMNGVQDDEEDYEDEEFEHVGDGREPIPRRPRPAIPERPEGDPGSEDEDFLDEKPQVVVLKEGKHLNEREAENIRRAEKGLPPLPDPEKVELPSDPKDSETAAQPTSKDPKSGSKGLSFASSSSAAFKSKKRKAVGDLDELKAELETKTKGSEKGSSKGGKKSSAKKAKKESKTLLSFGDDA